MDLFLHCWYGKRGCEIFLKLFFPGFAPRPNIHLVIGRFSELPLISILIPQIILSFIKNKLKEQLGISRWWTVIVLCLSLMYYLGKPLLSPHRTRFKKIYLSLKAFTKNNARLVFLPGSVTLKAQRENFIFPLQQCRALWSSRLIIGPMLSLLIK